MNKILSHSSFRKFKKRTMQFLFMVLWFFLILFGVYHPRFRNGQWYIKKLFTVDNVEEISLAHREGYKTILIWNDPGRIETAAFGFGHKTFLQHGCEVSKCSIFDYSNSYLPLEYYDAIIVNVQRLKKALPNFKREAQQRVIFLTQEPPTLMPIDIFTMDNFFNWTMTYKLNSDIRLLYGRIEPGPTAPKTPEETRKMIQETHRASVTNYAANKTRAVAWMVSHCHTDSYRESYARELSRFISVDIYGKCGNLTCPRNASHWISDPECYDMIETKYKFYLSFENSICNDYVTEKFFKIIDHNIIPIVYGGANYSQIAPPHSYINALDFTPEKLGNYLKLLDANDTLYNEYFWWKSHYIVDVGEEQLSRHGFCDLCKKLHQDKSVKFYPELTSEWHTNTQCRRFVPWRNEGFLSWLGSFIFL